MEIHHSDGHRDFDRHRHHVGSNRVHGSSLTLNIERPLNSGEFGGFFCNFGFVAIISNFGYAEGRRHLGNARIILIQCLFFSPHLLSKLKVRAKE